MNPSDLVFEQDITGDDEEKRDALNEERDPRGLNFATGNQERSKEDGDNNDGEGVEFGEPGNDDTRKAIRVGDALLKAVDRASDLSHARQTCQSAGDHEDEDGVGSDINTSVTGGTNVIADEGDLVTPFALVDDEINNYCRDEPKEDAGMGGHAREGWYLFGIIGETRHPGLFWKSWGHLEAGITPFSEDPIVVPEDGNVVEHESGDNLVDIEFGLQESRDKGIERASDHSENRH